MTYLKILYPCGVLYQVQILYLALSSLAWQPSASSQGRGDLTLGHILCSTSLFRLDLPHPSFCTDIGMSPVPPPMGRLPCWPPASPGHIRSPLCSLARDPLCSWHTLPVLKARLLRAFCSSASSPDSLTPELVFWAPATGTWASGTWWIPLCE